MMIFEQISHRFSAWFHYWKHAIRIKGSAGTVFDPISWQQSRRMSWNVGCTFQHIRGGSRTSLASYIQIDVSTLFRCLTQYGASRFMRVDAQCLSAVDWRAVSIMSWQTFDYLWLSARLFCKTNSVVRSIFYAISLSLEMKLTHSVREFTYRYSVDSYCTIQQEDNIRNEHL